jgi:hypothetical protein
MYGHYCPWEWAQIEVAEEINRLMYGCQPIESL